MENFNFCAVSFDFFFFLLPDPSFYLHKYLLFTKKKLYTFFISNTFLSNARLKLKKN